jgi:hypothetical protein
MPRLFAAEARFSFERATDLGGDPAPIKAAWLGSYLDTVQDTGV